MIGNTRQLQAARRKLRELTAGLEGLNDQGDLTSIRYVIDDLAAEIAEFERIQHGIIREFGITSVDDLGPAVVKARIAAGLNQRELAAELGVTEQAVQKDESNYYERAGLARIADILDILDHQLVGLVRPASSQVDTQIVAYPPAIQGRVRTHPAPSSQQNSARSNLTQSRPTQTPEVMVSSVPHPAQVLAAQNSIKVGTGS